MNNRLKRWGAVALSLMCALLSGCYDALHIDDQCYPVAVGVDLGETSAFRFSFVVPNDSSNSEEGGSQGFFLLSAEADTIFEAKEVLDSSLPWLLDFTHITLVVCSEETARSGAMQRLFDDGPRELKIRQTASILVANPSAEEFLKGLEFEPSVTPSRLISDLFLLPASNASFLDSNLAQYYEGQSGDTYDPVVAYGAHNKKVEEADQEKKKEENGEAGEERQGENKQDQPAQAELGQGEEEPQLRFKVQGFAGEMLREGGMESEIGGAALFKGGVMVNKLDKNQTQFLMIGRGDFEAARVTISRAAGEKGITLNINAQAGPRVDLYLDPNPSAYVRISLQGEIITGVKEDEFSQDIGLSDSEIEGMIAQYVHDGLEGVEQICRLGGCDSLGFGRYAVKKFSRKQSWEEYDWGSALSELEVEWEVSFQLLKSQPNYQD